MKLTLNAAMGLAELLRDENAQGMSNQNPFPGAIGRRGSALVRLGLAINLGRHIYANNRPEIGERPDAYVRFELTNKGRKAAKKLFQKPR